MRLDHITLLTALLRSGLSTTIRESTWAVMALEAVHLIGLTLLGGPAIILGLGALRRDGLRGLSVRTLAAALLPVLWLGLLLMAVSGTLIAASMPFKYYGNAAFRWKMVLLVIALATTAALLRSSRRQTDGLSSSEGNRPRVLAFAALLLWLGVGFSGRLIGFL